MVEYLKKRKLSKEGKAVMTAGLVLWQTYFERVDDHATRDLLKLNRPDVGWYQIRNALKKRHLSGAYKKVDFTDFETAYRLLSEKLRPDVFSLGFLKA